MILNNCNRFFLIVIVYLLLHSYLKAQQIVFTDDNQWPAYSGDDPFQPLGESLPEIKDLKPFIEKHVKTIRFYDARQILFCYYELDPTGKISAQGYRCAEYFGIKRTRELDGNSLVVTSWYLDTLLMRVDSQLVRHRIYERADTLMEFRETRASTHKRGLVINKHNRFLSHNSEHKQYKSDYDSTQLFLTLKKNYAAGFHASVRAGAVNLDTATLREKEHRFFKAYKRIFLDTVFVQGERQEHKPDISIPCGTYASGDPGKQTFNENGLFEARYSVWDEEKVALCTARYEYYDKP